jgi:hypothetical protein
MTETDDHYTAFAGTRMLASGPPDAVVAAAKQAVEDGESAALLVFDDSTGRIVDLDLRGPAESVLAQLAFRRNEPEESAARGRGRPRLGVVAREVTLLPRHWDWLASQPGGASVALRKLVDAARTANAAADRMRQAREAADRFMMNIGGDLPGYEEAARGLYAGNRQAFASAIAGWPADVRAHAERLAAAAFADQAAAS